MATLNLDELHALAERALATSGANAAMAASTAKALVAADAQGLASHGVARVPQYAGFLRNGRADGKAVAAMVRAKGAAILVDAKDGLAFPACDLAIAEAIVRAREYGIAIAGVTNSHHFGVAAYHLEAVAAAIASLAPLAASARVARSVRSAREVWATLYSIKFNRV